MKLLIWNKNWRPREKQMKLLWKISRTYKAMLNEIESEKLPIAPKELDSFWVGLISLVVILFLLIFGGYGLIKLLL